MQPNLLDQQLRTAFCLICLSALLAVVPGCHYTPLNETCLDRILKSGKIVMITLNNANSYYLYRDKPAGFEYDMGKAFAEYLDVELEVITPGWSNMAEYLAQGKGDFIAAGITITPERQDHVAFSDPYMSVQQRLIMHKKNYAIQSLEDIDNRTVHVLRHTSYHRRLEELIGEGVSLKLQLYDTISTEEMLRRVAEKEIELTVADSHIALLNRRYYPDIKMSFPVSEKQSLGWAVRKGDDSLLEKINEFFDTIRETGRYGKIYEKYYANVEIFDYVDLKKFHIRVDTRLPRYINMIKKESDKYGFDWRLIAAVIYQESHLDPRARSYTGVRGLMQVTRLTAKEMGISNRLDPRQSIQAGVKYLAKMHRRFAEIENPRERMLFALASYNIGYGHVRDAQQIARSKGLDPHKWASMEKTLPLLRSPRYYKRTKYGYARGTEPVRYVDRIVMYYDILRQKI